MGKVDETKFYHAHLGEKSDGIHLGLPVVNDAPRPEITKEGAETLPWEEGKWHKVRLVRDVGAGTITAWCDGAQVMSAEDKTFGKGKIGLGSFDDPGSFRNVEIAAN